MLCFALLCCALLWNLMYNIFNASRICSLGGGDPHWRTRHFPDNLLFRNCVPLWKMMLTISNESFTFGWGALHAPQPASPTNCFLNAVLLCCAVLCCAVLCCAALCCAVLCCSCCAVLCSAVLRCAALCCAVLCSAVVCCAH